MYPRIFLVRELGLAEQARSSIIESLAPVTAYLVRNYLFALARAIDIVRRFFRALWDLGGPV